METRKIQLIGNRSYSISLPKEWIKENKLKEKQPVFVERTRENDLKISTTKKEDKKEIEINLEDIDNISEFLMLCYVKNINNLSINIHNSNYKKIAEIRNMVLFLEGYDIILEDKAKIEIAFLFNNVQITLPQIQRRMIYLLNSFFQAIQNKDEKTCTETETSIDRLYYLSKRIIFSCIHDQKLRQENKVHSFEDLFFYKDISKKLENIGDSMYELSKNKINQEQEKKVQLLTKLLDELFSSKKDMQKINKELNCMNMSYEHRTDAIIHKIHERIKDIFENLLSIEYNNKYF